MKDTVAVTVVDLRRLLSDHEKAMLLQHETLHRIYGAMYDEADERDMLINNLVKIHGEELC
jgi:hypothetical protein